MNPTFEQKLRSIIRQKIEIHPFFWGEEGPEEA